MRGKALKTMPKQRRCRITPAYAGKSSGFRLICTSSTDHPRLCGEKQKKQPTAFLTIGSPPPMRGKGNGKEIAHLLHGITPAYAGKRSSTSFRISSYQDHPRLCGEKPFRAFGIKLIAGSPPPMRGKVTKCLIGLRVMRITPAYAGKSHSHPCANHCI